MFLLLEKNPYNEHHLNHHNQGQILGNTNQMLHLKH